MGKVGGKMAREVGRKAKGNQRSSEKPIGEWLKALRLRMGRTRAEAQRRRGGNREGEEFRNGRAVFRGCLGLPKRYS